MSVSLRLNIAKTPSGGGTKEIIETGISKSGRNKGGINALDVNTDGMTSSEIWNNVNRPWLENAVARGDVIKAVSDPLKNSNLTNSTTFNGLSYFGMEHNYLINVAGYTYNPVTKLYTP